MIDFSRSLKYNFDSWPEWANRDKNGGNLVMKKKEERADVFIGDTIETVEARKKFKLIRKGLSLGLCGTIILNSVVPAINGVSLFSGLTTAASNDRNHHTGVVRNICTVPEMKPKSFKGMEAKIRVLLEELERQKAIDEELERQRAFDECIENYCPYFNLNSQKVIEIARGLTSNYTISLSEFVNYTSYEITNEEMAIILFTYRLQADNLSMSWSILGVNAEDLFIDQPVHVSRADGEALVLENGDSGSQFMGKVCDVLGLDKTYVLPIALLETGRFNSPLCRIKNNFGGLRTSAGWLSFPTPEAGIIAYCLNLKGYEKFGFGSLEEMSSMYAPVDNMGSPNTLWVKNVRSIHYEVMNNMGKFFYEEEPQQELGGAQLTIKPVQ